LHRRQKDVFAHRPEKPGSNVRKSGNPQGVELKPSGDETGTGASQEKTNGKNRRNKNLPARDLKTTNTHAERDSEIRDQPRQMSRVPRWLTEVPVAGIGKGSPEGKKTAADQDDSVRLHLDATPTSPESRFRVEKRGMPERPRSQSCLGRSQDTTLQRCNRKERSVSDRQR
jgi:hypothetical protein